MTEAENPELTDLLAEVHRIEVQTTRLVSGFMAGSYRSVFRGSGIEFDEVREYTPGDDPRTVDWNVTARMGRPFVKKYVDERDLSVVFVLDLSASMDAGVGQWSARQMAARICSCLALSAVRNNDRVGLVACSDGVDKYVPARKGLRHALSVVRDCLALPGRSVRTDLSGALELVARGIRRHVVVFVLSDFLTDGWQKPLTLCARRHDVIAARLLVPERIGPLERGLVRAREPESGDVRRIDWSSRTVRSAYREELRRRDEDTRRDLWRARVDCMDVAVPRRPDHHAVSGPLLRFFRMRELRGAKR